MSAPESGRGSHEAALPYLPSVDAFERGDIDAERFDHRAHVYVAYRMLDDGDAVAVMGRFLGALARLTRKLGAEGKYHETISCFFILLIAERRARGRDGTWAAFAAANPDLLANSRELLSRHYSDDRLWSAAARRQFLLPDLAAKAA